MPPGKIQVTGFCNDDNYNDVVRKGAKGMSITHPPDNLQFIVSNGLVANGPLQSGKPWTLGNFIEELGGTQAKSKRTFGVCVPPILEIVDEDDTEDTDNVSVWYLRYLTMDWLLLLQYSK